VKKQDGKVMRAALYPRVSTEEQVMHGYSLNTQEEALKQYAEEHGYVIVGIYRDEGFSARKPAMKRKVMQELLEDVKAKKIDIILFTKLDRWFRSVGEYHKVQEILDKHHVVWRAILEDYQTETADGRLKVNIMLSVAENEADRTAERIQFVFSGKIRRGEYCYGGTSTPWGYKAEIVDGVRRLVKDPDMEDAAQAFWDKLQKYQNIRRAGKETNMEFGLHRAHKSWMATVRSEFNSGEYRGVKGFCQAYIEREAWEALQHPELRVKSTQHNRVYLFTGLIRCPVCGNTLKSTYKTVSIEPRQEYFSYRCNSKSLGYCTYNHCISERKIEKELLAHLDMYLEQYMVKASIIAKPEKPKKKKTDVARLNEQFRRLNNVYMAGNITDVEYNRKADELRASIAKASAVEADAGKPPVDLTAIRKVLNGNFRDQYDLLTREERQRFWRSIILEIHLDGTSISGIVFK